jgi:hypothetical protein
MYLSPCNSFLGFSSDSETIGGFGAGSTRFQEQPRA